ncbi:apolipoprotein A-II-like [Varanus komodoensis]|uniref:apolipoprotein A-II-like n=1 Tax=Varanus komodoensis TaxID=61221 RepID=UPI001CF7CED6|nr:apolipoprotein A-II-like [Varanus komodoensis]
MRKVTDAEPKAPIKGPGTEEGIKEPSAPPGTHFITQSGSIERIPQKLNERSDPAMMKVLILAVLLVSVCFLEGAVMKQQVEEPTPSESLTPESLGESVLQLLKEFFAKSNVNELTAQAR